VIVCAAGGALGGLDVVGCSALVDAVAGSSQVLVPRASDIAPPGRDLLVGVVDALGELVGVGLGRVAGLFDVELEVVLRLLRCGRRSVLELVGPGGEHAQIL
jgi:hypothetical protein